MLDYIYLFALLAVVGVFCYALGSVNGYKRGADEIREIWQECLDEVRDIYRDYPATRTYIRPETRH